MIEIKISSKEIVYIVSMLTLVFTFFKLLSRNHPMFGIISEEYWKGQGNEMGYRNCIYFLFLKVFSFDKKEK